MVLDFLISFLIQDYHGLMLLLRVILLDLVSQFPYMYIFFRDHYFDIHLLIFFPSTRQGSTRFTILRLKSQQYLSSIVNGIQKKVT